MEHSIQGASGAKMINPDLSKLTGDICAVHVLVLKRQLDRHQLSASSRPTKEAEPRRLDAPETLRDNIPPSHVNAQQTCQRGKLPARRELVQAL